ncbi:MAG: type IV pilin-like G/H family protein [Leptolyngbya sp.]|nr:type IV pilin-like G/H family protein [Leptolyngbya sp.]
MTNSNSSNGTPSNGASAAPSSNNTTKIVLIVLGVTLCCLGVPILGVISAIALPSFLNQADRAREAEGVTTLGALTRAQQAYRLENPEFAPTVEALDMLAADSPNYTYAVVPQPDPATSVYLTATAQVEGVSSFSAGVFLTDPSGETGATTQVICEGEDAPPAPPSFDPASGIATCPAGSLQR